MPKRDDRKSDSAALGDKHQNGATPKIAPIETVDINALEPSDWNPNIEDGTTFNELVENIQRNGFSGAIDVVPLGEGKYRIIGGEHRWKAAKLAGMKEIPVAVNVMDEDMQKIQTVALNVLRGKLDPVKFTKLFKELEDRYGRNRVRELMGMASKDGQFRQLMKDVRQSLPKEVQEQIDARSDKIRNVEDLATVVNSLYARYGGTLKYSFMFFSYGGQTHLMVKLNEKSFKVVKKMVEDCQDRGEDANEEILRRLT